MTTNENGVTNLKVPEKSNDPVLNASLSRTAEVETSTEPNNGARRRLTPRLGGLITITVSKELDERLRAGDPKAKEEYAAIRKRIEDMHKVAPAIVPEESKV